MNALWALVAFMVGGIFVDASVEAQLMWPAGNAVNADTNLWLPQFNDSLWSAEDTANCIGDSGLEFSNALHPSVCKFGSGFGVNAWKYVMAYTPICVSDKDENPHVAVSYDGDHWFTPFTGADSTVIYSGSDSAYGIGFRDSTLKLPMYFPSTFGGLAQDYLSDCDLFSIGDTVVYLAFRLTKDRSPRDSNFVLLTHSYDLVHWDEVDTLLADTESLISPTFVVNSDMTLTMWCVEYELNGIAPDSTIVVRYEAVDPGSSLMLSDTVEFVSNPGYDVWHFSIIDNGFDNRLALVVEDSLDGMIGGAKAKFRLCEAYSTDGGQTFMTRSEPIFEASVSGWDESYIYRSDGVWIDELRKDSLEMYYSASGQGGWHTGRTVVTFGSCCLRHGDFNHDNSVDISDLTTLVSYLFESGEFAACPEEASINGVGDVDITDLTFLVDYLFAGGAAPPGC